MSLRNRSKTPFLNTKFLIIGGKQCYRLFYGGCAVAF
nr:MAG TPA: hypothetical protein [Caudoviricetes sp.]